jgi:hypothetical protein
LKAWAARSGWSLNASKKVVRTPIFSEQGSTFCS